MSTEDTREALREAFMAGFSWRANGTDANGGYSGGSIDDGFIDWLSANRLAAPVGEKERDTRKPCTCLGTCRGAEGLGAGWRCALEKTHAEP